MGRHQSGKVIILTAMAIVCLQQFFDLLFLCGLLMMDDVSLDVNEVYHLVSAYQTGGWLSPASFLGLTFVSPRLKVRTRCHR